MALGTLRAARADWAVSTTGIAGPDGGSAEKPVGLVYVGVAHGQQVWTESFQFRGDREWVRTLACQNALNMLRLKILYAASSRNDLSPAE